MEKRAIIIIVLVFALLALIAGFYGERIDEKTGKSVSTEAHTIGPSQEEQDCMRPCASHGCEQGDMACMKLNSEKCMAQCSVQKPEVTEETSCMESCVLEGCGEVDFACQTQNKDRCEKECNMIKEPEAKSEEEQCIRDCVNRIEPGLICTPGEGGEKGGEVCQRCANECVHLYAGPCLNEEKLEEKKRACKTCEHCYGEPKVGDSGEGYECIVDVECKDASSEFGDDPGTGEGIAESEPKERITERMGKAVGNVLESIGDFFRWIFGAEEKTGITIETP